MTKKISLDDLYTAYKKYMYIEDSDLIDLVLAVAISRFQKEAKLWLIIIGASSDGKTELVKCLEDKEISKIVKNLTAKTLVNGYVDKEKHPDLALKLRNKIMLIPEMASILKLHPNEKAQVWAQLRDLYDGYAGKQSGEGVDILYKDLNVTLIACSTPTIDSQVLVHQDLGTREFLYRTAYKNSEKLMLKIFSNINGSNKARYANEFKVMVKEFLKDHTFRKSTIQSGDQKFLSKLAKSLTKLRATAEVDYTTGELNNLIYPEEPARILSQLIVLWHSLNSLDEKYNQDKTKRIIQKIVFSSCSQIRLKVLVFLIKNKGLWFSRKKISKDLKIGNKTVYRECNILTHLGLLNISEETPNADLPLKTIKRWQINENSDVSIAIADKFDLILNVEEKGVH